MIVSKPTVLDGATPRGDEEVFFGGPQGYVTLSELVPDYIGREGRWTVTITFEDREGEEAIARSKCATNKIYDSVVDIEKRFSRILADDKCREILDDEAVVGMLLEELRKKILAGGAP